MHGYILLGAMTVSALLFVSLTLLGLELVRRLSPSTARDLQRLVGMDGEPEWWR